MAQSLTSRKGRLFVFFLLCAVIGLAVLWVIVPEYARRALTDHGTTKAISAGTELSAQFAGRDEALSHGLLSAEDQAVLDKAAETSGMIRYRLFNQDGIVVAASELEELGRENNRPYFKDRVRRGKTLATMRQEQSPEGAQRTVAMAYVPIMDGGNFKGAIQVHLDVSLPAWQLQEQMSSIEFGLLALLVVFGAGCIYFLHRRRRAQQRLGVAAGAELAPMPRVPD